MKRRRIYICGPISRGNLAHNVNQATAAFIALAKAGFAPLCPHWSVYAKPCGHVDGGTRTIAYGCVNGNSEMTHDDWMGIDIPWVEVADAVLRLPGESTGADRECEAAFSKQIPIFESVQAIIDWRDGNLTGVGPCHL